MAGDGKMTEYENKFLKEAICNMIDEGRTYGHIDTVEMKENTQHRGISYYDFVRKEWKFSINIIRINEYAI